MPFIPLTNKISWHNPPILTISLILINLFVYIVIQNNDDEYSMKSLQYYRNSGLAGIELFYYADYLNKTESYRQIPDFKNSDKIDEEVFWSYYRKMMNDDLFQKQLLEDRVITPEKKEYSSWKEFRKEYEALKGKIISDTYGFKPAQPTLLTSFTSMFLHGSSGHLIGNMVFLWLVSCVLEYGCGRIFYLVIYFVGGLAADGLFTLFNPGSLIPCIGASGAISGLMGAYAVLFGMTKIKVFYSLGFYFNYTSFPAVFLLPIWISSELVSQYLFGEVSSTAYMAHIGGLAGGGLLGFINLKFMKSEAKKIFEQDPKENIPKLLSEALICFKNLNLDKARSLMQQILAVDPDNREVLFHLFNIDKLDPKQPRFHETASRLFSHLLKDARDIDVLNQYFKDYLLLGKSIKLHFDLLFKMSAIFITHGYLKESEQILAFFLRYNPVYPNIPLGLLNLGKALLKKGSGEKAKKCLIFLLQKFPNANETPTAQAIVKRIK